MEHNSTNQLSAQQKQEILTESRKHVLQVGERLEVEADKLLERSKEYRENLKEFADIDIDDAASDSAAKELAIAKVRLLEGMSKDLRRIKDAPYFIRMDVTWPESGKTETLYFGKTLYNKENIYSWVSPISTLRYSDIGSASYEKPDGTHRTAVIHRKDNFLITGGEIVFMTHENEEYSRQVVFQKHLNERKEFLLPEIVAELDRLQDEIIRSDPKGPFLISGPAGSGKTTLALHRVAYLVLTPEFKDYFTPDRIIVFVSNQGDIDYFQKLLPELGIDGVRITTFMQWAISVTNSRYTKLTKERFKPLQLDRTLEWISKNNFLTPLPPRLVLDELRKFKQQMIEPLEIRERRHQDVYPALHSWYKDGMVGLSEEFSKMFKAYLEYQKHERFLDEVDVTILVKSVEHQPKTYTHVVIDEVQNWTPQQLDIVTSIATRTHKSITFIGDVRQRTKPFTINDWSEISQEFEGDSPRVAELLKVYRNSKQILEHLAEKGYSVNTDTQKIDGSVTTQSFENLEQMQDAVRTKLESLDKNGQIGILSRFQHTIDRLEYLGHGQDNIHVLTVEEAQGLEFDTVFILDTQDFGIDFEEAQYNLSPTSRQQYTDQGRFLYYVAATRAKKDLILMGR